MDRLYIIAECAQGYAAPSLDASLNLALWLTRSAKAAGADAVKFQLVYASELATEDYKYFGLFKSLELGRAGWGQVADLARTLGLDLIFDIFGESSLQLSEDLGVAMVKLHPTDFTNLNLIRRVAASSIPHVIAGCGGCTLDEITATIEEFKGRKPLTLLHGFQGYPTSRTENCLARIGVLKQSIDSVTPEIRLGFADHADPLSSDSTHLAAASLGFGISVLEKHLTLARCLQLEDHESALSPDEFLAFVNIMRACYEAKADGLCADNSFELPSAEISYRTGVSRHVVALSSLNPGHTILPSDVCLKRTASLVALTDPLSVIGKKTCRSIKSGIAFTSDILES